MFLFALIVGGCIGFLVGVLVGANNKETVDADADKVKSQTRDLFDKVEPWRGATGGK